MYKILVSQTQRIVLFRAYSSPYSKLAPKNIHQITRFHCCKDTKFPILGGGEYPPQQGRSQPHSPGWARVPLSSFFFLQFWSIYLIFPETLLFFFLILVLRVGGLPTREGPGYATAPQTPPPCKRKRQSQLALTRYQITPPGVETDTPVNVNTHNRFQVI